MKKCPNCNQLFTDDNMFCLEDGTSLLMVSDTGPNPLVFPTSGEMPTQYVERPVTAAAAVSKDASKWLYLVIGILATALVAVTAFLFLGRDTGKKDETADAKNALSQTGQKDPEATKNVQPNTQSSYVANTQGATPAPPTINPNLTPAGNWRGDWNSKTTYFTATASFTETGGKVSGQIVWTLQRTSNPKKLNKVGVSATEYVQGTFNPATRMVSLRGYRKDDPNNIVILDRYNLSLAENNQALSGRSISGNFVLRR
jgi:hypothetical protein